MANWNLLPKSHREKIIWSNLFKSFKDTISKTNICFRQHHDFSKENFSRKRFRTMWSKHTKSCHKNNKKNSCSYVTIRELQARKHNQFSAKNVFCERQNSEKTNISWYQKIEIFEFSWNWILFQKLLNLWKQPKGRKISNKLSRKRWQVINFSPLSSQIRVKTLWNSSFPFHRFYIW